MRLSIHLNPFAYMSRIGGEGSTSLLQAAVAADLAGADGIVVRPDQHGFVTGADVARLQDAADTHLALEIEPGEGTVREAMELHPHQVTFVAPIDAEGGLDTAMLGAEGKESIRSLHAAGIEVAALLKPGIPMLKELRRIGADIVVLDASAFAGAREERDAISAFEEIEASALAAEKLGLRVIAQGGLDHRAAALLGTLGTIEELVLDQRLFARAFLLGLDKAVGEFRQSLQWTPVRGS